MNAQDRITFHPEMTDEEYVMWFTSRAGYNVRMVTCGAFGFNRAWAVRLHDAEVFDLPYNAMAALVERGMVINCGDIYLSVRK